jgi:hypothetical protein
MLEDMTLRDAYAAAETTAPHVDEESWERLACGELSAEEREQAIDHASKCSECASVLRALLVLEREAHELDPLVPAGIAVTSPRPRGRNLMRGAIAVAAAVAAATIVWLTVPLSSRVPQPPVPDPDTLRSVGESERPVPRSPLDEVARAPERFSWEGSADARAYEVELFDADGELIWESGEVVATSIPWPETHAPEPGRYYWRVVAIQTERGERRASPLVSFELTR